MQQGAQLVDSPATALPRLALLVWSAALLSVIVAAPLAAAAARPEGWFLYRAFDLFCHQQPQRCWHIEGYPLAVCARCLGLYAGVLLAALGGLRLPRKAIGGALALLAVSWAAESTGFVVVSNEIRCLTGLALGASIGAVALAWPGSRHLTRRQTASG